MNEKILIVEDDILVASDIKLMLQSFGYKITGIASTASKALEMFNHELPDLVICDIKLRTKRTGIDFVEKARKIAFVPVIYLTAFTDEETLTKAVATAPESYLTKPFTRIQLRTSVKFALEKSNSLFKNNNSHKKELPAPSNRELDVLQLLHDGLNSRKIGEKLNISIQTVQTHRKNLMAKYKVNTTIELIELAHKFKLVK